MLDTSLFNHTSMKTIPTKSNPDGAQYSDLSYVWEARAGRIVSTGKNWLYVHGLHP